MTEFVKLKNVKFFDHKWDRTDHIRMTGTLVLRHRGFWPWNQPYEVEHDVWSCFNDSFRFIKWRSNGKYLDKDLTYLVEMASAFGDVEYAS